MNNGMAWTIIRDVAMTLGRGWVNLAAADSLLGPTVTVSQARSHRFALADWPSVAKHARLSSASRVAVDVDYLAAMCWYSNAVQLTPDYHAAKVHADPRVRALAARDNSRYGPVFAPYIPWSALHDAPHGGRWDEARRVSLLHKPS